MRIRQKLRAYIEKRYSLRMYTEREREREIENVCWAREREIERLRTSKRQRFRSHSGKKRD